MFQYLTRLLFLFCLCFEKNLHSAENRSQNPLYQSLSSLDSLTEGLLNYQSAQEGWVDVNFRESLSKNWVPTEENFFQDPAVILSELRFNQFVKNDKKQTPKIPPLIHLIWMGSPPPLSVNLAKASWEKHHPAWQVKLWTDEEISKIQWSSQRSENLFKTAKNWAEKSDILRFEILYQFGGIYSDTDVVCLKSFEDLIAKNISFFAGFESNKIKRLGRPLIGSAIFGAEKNHPILMRCMDFTYSIEEAPTIHQHIRSGPGPITKASYEALEAGDLTVLLLPCSYLYPLPWEKRLASLNEIRENIQPESFAIHLWEGSWFDSYHPPKTE